MYAELTYKLLIKDDDGTVVKEDPPSGQSLTVEKDDLTEKGGLTFNLAAGAADVEQVFSNVDNANLLLIRTTEDISFKKNSNAGEVQYIVADKKAEAVKCGICLMTTSGITSLFFSNAGSVTATVELVFAAS